MWNLNFPWIHTLSNIISHHVKHVLIKPPDNKHGFKDWCPTLQYKYVLCIVESYSWRPTVILIDFSLVLLSCGHWTLDIGDWRGEVWRFLLSCGHWALDIGGEKSGDSIDDTSRFYDGSLWTLLNSNFKNAKFRNIQRFILWHFSTPMYNVQCPQEL